MKLIKQNASSHVLRLEKGDILFSYETPVAIKIGWSESYVRADYVGYSTTTSKHLNEFLREDHRKLDANQVLSDEEFFTKIKEMLP